MCFVISQFTEKQPSKSSDKTVDPGGHLLSLGLGFPLTSFVNLNKWLSFSEPQFYCIKNGIIKQQSCCEDCVPVPKSLKIVSGM